MSPPRAPASRAPFPAASWPAILAGALVATSVSLTLLALGAGLRFASISAWPNRTVTAATFTLTTAIWLMLSQGVSAGMGGYVAGRLRIAWTGTHARDVLLRDTTHGLVAWAMGTALMAVAALTSIDFADAAAEVSRKGVAQFSIYAALSMLIGAFIASAAAAIGGRQRALR